MLLTSNIKDSEQKCFHKQLKLMLIDNIDNGGYDDEEINKLFYKITNIEVYIPEDILKSIVEFTDNNDVPNLMPVSQTFYDFTLEHSCSNLQV